MNPTISGFGATLLHVLHQTIANMTAAIRITLQRGEGSSGTIFTIASIDPRARRLPLRWLGLARARGD
jgi:hypothetical protein